MTAAALLSTIPGWFVFAFLIWGVLHNGSPIAKPRKGIPYSWPVEYSEFHPAKPGAPWLDQ